MATAKSSIKIGGRSKLSTGGNNKKRNLIIALIVILLIAAIGGFFVYRSYASGRYVFRAVPTGGNGRHIAINGTTNGAKDIQDGLAMATETYLTGNNGVQLKLNYRIPKGTLTCFYFAEFDKRGVYVPLSYYQNKRKSTGYEYYKGVGSYIKACHVGTGVNDKIYDEPTLNGLGIDMSKIRVLKAVAGDYWGDSAFSKDPYN